ncbi:MAG TPA: RcnB family protein [Sphingomicrobium sp.]|nr:RcnB family protein [Sphingomicrobium sp.]
MRKFLIAVLLAGAAATPAIAGHDPDHQSNDNRQQAHEEHQQARQERQQERAERPQFTAPRMQAPQAQMRQQGFNGGGQQHVEGQRFEGRPNFAGNGGAHMNADAGVAVQDNGVRRFEGNPRVRAEQQQQVYAAPGPRMVTAPRDRARGQRVQGGDFRQSDRALPGVMRSRNPLVVSNVPRPGTEPPLRVDGRHHQVNWNTDWRNDRRYDWRDRRRHHRSLFHFGIFIDPFGWDYQPFSIGYRMWPEYYGNQYWIDPGIYGLPYPPPGAVWIRYWNDAILVDTYSGTVIDVIPGFFW